MVGPRTLSVSDRMLRDASAFDAVAACAGEIIPSDQMIPGEYPIYLDRAAGSHLWDVDGNRYIDYLCGYGAVMLGHADEEVDRAYFQEARSGPTLGFMKSAQAQLCQILVNTIPHAELALLLRTGSDATSAAVRLARAATGRERVVRWGYNGWHDWCAVREAGIPSSVRELASRFEFNEFDSFVRAVARPCEVACVVMMPMLLDPPSGRFLHDIQDFCRTHGIVFVLDEMRSGFRLAEGGAQQLFDLDADMVTVGKAMANGYCVSAVVGKEALLRRLGEIHITGTYFSSAAEMVAAVTCIRLLKHRDAVHHVWRQGADLQARLQSSARNAGVPVQIHGLPPMPYLTFAYPTDSDSDLAKRVFYTSMIRQGILLHPNHHWFVSASLANSDVNDTIAAASIAFGEVAAAAELAG